MTTVSSTLPKLKTNNLYGEIKNINKIITVYITKRSIGTNILKKTSDDNFLQFETPNNEELIIDGQSISKRDVMLLDYRIIGCKYFGLYSILSFAGKTVMIQKVFDFSDISIYTFMLYINRGTIYGRTNWYLFKKNNKVEMIKIGDDEDDINIDQSELYQDMPVDNLSVFTGVGNTVKDSGISLNAVISSVLVTKHLVTLTDTDWSLINGSICYLGYMRIIVFAENSPSVEFVIAKTTETDVMINPLIKRIMIGPDVFEVRWLASSCPEIRKNTLLYNGVYSVIILIGN